MNSGQRSARRVFQLAPDSCLLEVSSSALLRWCCRLDSPTMQRLEGPDSSLKQLCYTIYHLHLQSRRDRSYLLPNIVLHRECFVCGRPIIRRPPLTHGASALFGLLLPIECILNRAVSRPRTYCKVTVPSLCICSFILSPGVLPRLGRTLACKSVMVSSS